MPVSPTPKDCLIDTGAHTSFMSESFAKTQQLKPRKVVGSKIWITADGTPLDLCGCGQVVVTLKLQQKEIQATFVVAKRIVHDVIIGRNILREWGAVIDYKGNKLCIDDDGFV